MNIVYRCVIQGCWVAGIFFGSVWANLSVGATRYESVVVEMENLAAANPELVSLIELGVNDQGVTIFGMRVESSSFSVEERGNQLLVGTHHGNEELSVDVVMSFTTKLIATLQDPSAAQFEALSSRVFFIFPVLNISGYNALRREETSPSGGTLDPNRDYPDPCSYDQPFRLSSTSALASFVEQEHIIGAVTVHGYIGTFTFPWGTYTSQTHTPDHQIFQSMGRQAAGVSGYSTGTHKDVIYPTVGAFEDWAYHAHGVWVMLLEMARRPNVSRDAASLLTYFTLIPSERSLYHEHTGRCTNNKFTPVMARP